MESGEFEVTHHYYIEKRGGFVIGRIQSGIFKIGMKVPIDEDGTSLTISGIEYIDNVKTKMVANALIFKEKPSLDYVKKVFPVGSVLRADK
jgi:hypothetical protein